MNSLEGKIEVQIYDKNNNLKRVVQGKNSVTNIGIKRLCEILTQGIRNGLTETESLMNVPLNTLPNGQNSIGVNIVEWKDKEKSTFDFSENIMGLSESAVMFQENNSGDYSIITKGDLATSTNFYYPNKDGKNDKNTSGWVCDLGLKHIYKKEFMFSQNPVYLCDDYGVGYTNVKYNSLKIIDKKGYTLESGVDYEVLSWGDYNSSPELYFLKDKYLNVSLFLTYSYFNVPNIPIIGFSFDCVNEANAQEAAKNLIAGWSWSLNQGKSKLPHLFPNLSGCPSGNSLTSWSNFSYNSSHQAIWYNPFGQKEKRFYIHSYPYAVINPTQLVWYAHLYNDKKCYFKNFSLLGVSLPKLMPQAIQLGTGTKEDVENNNENSLKSPIIGSKTLVSCIRNDGYDSIKFEIKLGFDDCNADDISEIGLYFPDDDSVFYSDAEYWNNKHQEDISGKNRIVKFDKIDVNKCNTKFSHGFFETPWNKQKDEKVTIIYTVKINWGN